jgi:3-deoxy-D-manno-octulosonate 8-phosphate phosphatase (KDO 8-P phosphatase)
MKINDALIEKIRQVKLAVFDVDGVMTDGALHYSAEGEEVKIFNTLDGHGMKMLMGSGVDIAIISGRQSQALARRCKDLGITQLFMAVEDKGRVYAELLASLKLQPHQVASIGDDVVDLPILLNCAFAAAVPAAPKFVRERIDYVTEADGGRGAVREFCEVIMAAQGTLDAALKKYLP